MWKLKKELCESFLRATFKLEDRVTSLNIIFLFTFFSQTFTIHRTVGERGGFSFTSVYHFHPLPQHLDISREIAAESSPLQIANSRAQTGNLFGFHLQVANH